VAQKIKVDQMDKFDFDAWSKMAKTDPDKFEQLRRDVIDNYISSSSNIRRLQGLQCNIDLERIRARTSLKACLRLSTLMWDAFMDMNNELNSYLKECYETTSASSHSRKAAKIIHIQTDYKRK
jgi:hypothetical protein